MAAARQDLTDTSERLRLAILSFQAVSENAAALTAGMGARSLSEAAASVSKTARMAKTEAVKVLRAAEAAEAASTTATAAVRAAEKAWAAAAMAKKAAAARAKQAATVAARAAAAAAAATQAAELAEAEAVALEAGIKGAPGVDGDGSMRQGARSLSAAANDRDATPAVNVKIDDEGIPAHQLKAEDVRKDEDGREGQDGHEDEGYDVDEDHDPSVNVEEAGTVSGEEQEGREVASRDGGVNAGPETEEEEDQWEEEEEEREGDEEEEWKEKKWDEEEEENDRVQEEERKGKHKLQDTGRPPRQQPVRRACRRQHNYAESPERQPPKRQRTAASKKSREGGSSRGGATAGPTKPVPTAGERRQVLCIAAPDAKAGEALVATSAEDSTVRLWDLRDGGGAGSGQGQLSSSPRVATCLCRCFGGEAVSSVVFGAGDANRLYCSAGGKVLEFDLRSCGGDRALLVTSSTAVFDDGEDEVNELAVHPNGDYVAAADDSGVVKVYSTRTRRMEKSLRNAHTNICHAVRFRPRASWDIASGALDSTLVFWDFSTGRVRRKLDLTEGNGASAACSASSSSPQQLFNPPFVHSVDFTSDGCYLAAGLGDSGVVVVDSKTRTPVGRCDGHSAPISQVHYPCFDSRLLVSAGNDQRLLVWDQRQFEQRSEPSSRTKGGGGDGGSSSGGGGGGGRLRQAGKKKGRAKGLNKQMLATATAGQPSSNDATSAKSDETGHCGSGGATMQEPAPREEGGILRCSRPLLSMRLEEKPNWVTSLATPYPAIAIADTSSVAKILRRHGGA
eukprot:g1991.t1